MAKNGGDLMGGMTCQVVTARGDVCGAPAAFEAQDASRATCARHAPRNVRMEWLLNDLLCALCDALARGAREEEARLVRDRAFDLVEELQHAPLARRCITCGCTDERACMTPHGGCTWAREDECSECVWRSAREEVEG